MDACVAGTKYFGCEADSRGHHHCPESCSGHYLLDDQVRRGDDELHGRLGLKCFLTAGKFGSADAVLLSVLDADIL